MYEAAINAAAAAKVPCCDTCVVLVKAVEKVLDRKYRWDYYCPPGSISARN